MKHSGDQADNLDLHNLTALGKIAGIDVFIGMKKDLP